MVNSTVMNHYSLEPANYSDYRDFLKTRFERLKSQNKNFSLQNCARRSGLSKSLLQFLFGKKRHISLDKLPGLAKTLKLTQEEEAFLYLMLCKDSSQNLEVRNHFETILGRLRSAHVKMDLQEEPEILYRQDENYFKNHLLGILQVLTRIEGFQEDPRWILENLKIHGLTENHIKEALKELEDLGQLARDEHSHLRSHHKRYWRIDPYDPAGYKFWTRSAETVAKLMQHPEGYSPSVVSNMILSLDEEHLYAASKYMNEVRHQLIDLDRASQKPTALIYVGSFMMTLAHLKK